MSAAAAIVRTPRAESAPLNLAQAIRDDTYILVLESYDPTKTQNLFRPLGGGIELGERGADAIRRAIAEELGAETEEPRYLAAIENLVVYDGEHGHEICLVYEVMLRDPSLYTHDYLDARES